MRTPDRAEIQPPILHTETQNEIHLPIAPSSPDAEPPNKFRRVGAIAGLAAAAAAALPIHAAADADRNHAPEPRMTSTTYVSGHALGENTQALRSSTDVYSGRVTLPASASRMKPVSAVTSLKAEAKKEPDSPGITLAKAMGVPEQNVRQGKNSNVKIAGQNIDLANYVSDERKAKPWRVFRDCLSNWAKQDLLVAGRNAGLDDVQLKKIAADPKAIADVMNGYVRENSGIKGDSRRFLYAGTTYKAKQARTIADSLVAAIKAPAPTTPAPKTPVPKPANPDTATNKSQAQPNTKVGPTKTGTDYYQAQRNKEVAVAYVKYGSIIIGGLAGIVLISATGAALYRRRGRGGDSMPFPILAQEKGWGGPKSPSSPWDATTGSQAPVTSQRERQGGRHRIDDRTDTSVTAVKLRQPPQEAMRADHREEPKDKMSEGVSRYQQIEDNAWSRPSPTVLPQPETAHRPAQMPPSEKAPPKQQPSQDDEPILPARRRFLTPHRGTPIVRVPHPQERVSIGRHRRMPEPAPEPALL